MYHVILVEGSDAVNDRKEGIAYFLLIEMHDVVSPLAILHLGPESRLLLRIQQSIVIANRSQ